MSTLQPDLAEREIIRLISEYDVKETRELIRILRAKIKTLKPRICNRDNSWFTRKILLATLKSKENTLDEQLDNRTSTPPSSDDEEEDDQSRWLPIIDILEKQTVKSIKVVIVSTQDDKATQTLQKKKNKIRKSLKDDDMAETWAIESRPWEKVSDDTKPAASLSMHNPSS